MHHAVNTLFVGSGITSDKTGGPVYTTVLDTEMEININDQENNKNDVECVENIYKILKQILKEIAS